MDIIVTGIPRSGTTLTCSLLNKLPQTVALLEPMNPQDLVGLAYPDEYLARVAAFFKAQRISLLQEGVAISKAREGCLPDNLFTDAVDQAGLRQLTVDRQEVVFAKPLAENFRLVVKHTNFLTATLEALLTRYPCYAVVRMPLAVLLSWHSINAPVNEGRIPMGEAFDPELRRTLDSVPDRLARQLEILRWCFSKYRDLLPPSHVIRYEDLVASGGRALNVIDPDASQMAEVLSSRNTSRVYDSSLVHDLAERLIADPSIYEGFYTSSDIAASRDAWVLGGRV